MRKLQKPYMECSLQFQLFRSIAQGVVERRVTITLFVVTQPLDCSVRVVVWRITVVVGQSKVLSTSLEKGHHIQHKFKLLHQHLGVSGVIGVVAQLLVVLDYDTEIVFVKVQARLVVGSVQVMRWKQNIVAWDHVWLLNGASGVIGGVAQ